MLLFNVLYQVRPAHPALVVRRGAATWHRAQVLLILGRLCMRFNMAAAARENSNAVNLTESMFMRKKAEEETY